jgi:hypothetical protein
MNLRIGSDMNRKHIEGIQIVAEGLGNLLADVVFVGGAVAEFYATGPASEEVRISDDIDCVIEISTRKEYYRLERLLEAKGFQHDTTPGVPICRWIFKHILIDIMPTKDEILGFSNRWYITGIENKIAHHLPDGNTIYIFPLEIFLASKLEAFNHRGGNDLRQSHDFEDIIYILDNNPDILIILSNSSEQIRAYMKSQFQSLYSRDDISEGIECALPYNADSDSVEKILNIFQFE